MGENLTSLAVSAIVLGQRVTEDGNRDLVMDIPDKP